MIANDSVGYSKVEIKRLNGARRCFDATGKLVRWPSKRAERMLVLWVIWSRFPARTQFREAEVNSMLRDWNDFADSVLLRRELCDLDLLRRTPSGSHYVRVEQAVPQDAAHLLDQVN